ncbi:uncharacterized protein G2W53_034010 [Senna tora]|uniref:Uncharacterized protein n=1 Tax=Senna tora TaxID=362788 RepID=A0A834WDE3_9FABA|nr:uncharacterized protein G2W53_034010 [Senna tora]
MGMKQSQEFYKHVPKWGSSKPMSIPLPKIANK